MAAEFPSRRDADSDDDVPGFCRTMGRPFSIRPAPPRWGRPAILPAVVDSRLRVRGRGSIAGVDCSVMPTLAPGNTNVPVVMIAERAADTDPGEECPRPRACVRRQSA